MRRRPRQANEDRSVSSIVGHEKEVLLCSSQPVASLSTSDVVPVQVDSVAARDEKG